MRIASFNVENLFSRTRAMNLANWAAGKPILDQYTRVNKLIQKAVCLRSGTHQPMTDAICWITTDLRATMRRKFGLEWCQQKCQQKCQQRRFS